MSEKRYPYHGGNFDRIIFDGDGSVWVPESEISKLRDLESENASLRGAVQGLGALCDSYKAENAKLRACLGDGCADCALGMGKYADSLCDPIKAENANLKERIIELEYERIMMFLELAGQWIRVKQREMEEG